MYQAGVLDVESEENHGLSFDSQQTTIRKRINEINTVMRHTPRSSSG
jgi:hypothetical protein